MPESQHTEWKALWKDDYLKWICAFANTEGGTLHIGRDDSGKAIGVEKPKKLLEDLPIQTLLSEHPSVPHNPAIANAFFRSGEHRAGMRRGSLPQAARRARRVIRARQIETWGRGIQRIFAACIEKSFGDEENISFQYFITTTTPPPNSMGQGSRWLLDPILDSRKRDARLLKENF